MKRINCKGFTTIEVLVCFVVVSVVMMSLFSVISAFNEKRIKESYRSRVYEYKNNLTNTIQADFIKKGLSSASITQTGSTSSDTGITYTVNCKLKDGTDRQLIVHQRFTKSSTHLDGNPTKSDDFYIIYGNPATEMIREDFPNLGEVAGQFDTTTNTFIKNDNYTECDGKPCINKDLQINNVLIYITNEENPDADSHVLSIYIGLYHPDLGTKYGINIVAPINYQSSNANTAAAFPTSSISNDCTSVTSICKTE